MKLLLQFCFCPFVSSGLTLGILGSGSPGLWSCWLLLRLSSHTSLCYWYEHRFQISTRLEPGNVIENQFKKERKKIVVATLIPWSCQESLCITATTMFLLKFSKFSATPYWDLLDCLFALLLPTCALLQLCNNSKALKHHRLLVCFFFTLTGVLQSVLLDTIVHCASGSISRSFDI